MKQEDIENDILLVEGDIKNNFSSVLELSGDVKDPKYTLKDVINIDIKDTINFALINYE